MPRPRGDLTALYENLELFPFPTRKRYIHRWRVHLPPPPAAKVPCKSTMRLYVNKTPVPQHFVRGRNGTLSCNICGPEEYLTLEKSRPVFLSALSMRIWVDTYKMGSVETGFMRTTMSAESTSEHLPAIIQAHFDRASVGRQQETEGRRDVKGVPYLVRAQTTSQVPS